MNVVVLGNVCIDKNKTEKTSYIKAGGPPIFMSLFFNKVKNASLTTIASYGVDFLPYKKGLTLYPSKPNASNTLAYENIIVDGKRSQKCHFYDNNLLPELSTDEKKIIEKADVLFIAPLIPYFSPDYVKEVVNQTSKDCLKILLPQGYFRNFDKEDNVIFREFKETDELLPFFNFVILSSDDYPNIEKLSLEWSKKYNTTIIITKAEKGAEVISKDGKINAMTDPISFEEIVDSVGAGDIFAASFGYYYSSTKNLEKSVRLANRAARERLLAT